MKISSERHSAREYAIRLLYCDDLLNQAEIKPLPVAPNWWKNDDRLSVRKQTDQFARELLDGVRNKRSQIDEIIREHAQHWRLERISIVDRNILRLGLYELQNYPETPTKVVLNECLELGKCYGDEDSVRFLNGILDSAARALRGDEA